MNLQQQLKELNVFQTRFRKFLPLVVIGLWGVVVLPLPNWADATTPLTKGEIQDLRNLVQLMPQNQPRRQARKRDAIIPGDGLTTGRASLADLRFNDGSLARVGERALFRFLPKTRNFNLSNGTVLMLIPPGKGQTRVNTPNAAAAIRGSALFVRYDQKTDTTIVGALTNSGIQVFNKDASQSQKLPAGQLMVVVKGKFQGLYEFDLRTFYETSNLVQGLNLSQGSIPNPDPAIAEVQAETAAAVAAQLPVTGSGVVENPSFLRLTPSSSNLSSQETIRDNSPTNTLLEIGQILPNNGVNVGAGNSLVNSKDPTTVRETETPIQTATPQPPPPTIAPPIQTATPQPPPPTIAPPIQTTTPQPPPPTIAPPIQTATPQPPPPTIAPPIQTATPQPPPPVEQRPTNPSRIQQRLNPK